MLVEMKKSSDRPSSYPEWHKQKRENKYWIQARQAWGRLKVALG